MNPTLVRSSAVLPVARNEREQFRACNATLKLVHYAGGRSTFSNEKSWFGIRENAGGQFAGLALFLVMVVCIFTDSILSEIYIFCYKKGNRFLTVTRNFQKTKVNNYITNNNKMKKKHISLVWFKI